MADIIQFGKKAQDIKSVRDGTLRQHKIDVLKKVFQCTRCVIKCAKCGTQLDVEPEKHSRYAGPHLFCHTCQEEYEDYKQRLSGESVKPQYYWHNEAWMKAWESWLEHQNWLEQYRRSKEFLQLLEEAENLLK